MTTSLDAHSSLTIEVSCLSRDNGCFRLLSDDKFSIPVDVAHIRSLSKEIYEKGQWGTVGIKEERELFGSNQAMHIIYVKCTISNQ